MARGARRERANTPVWDEIFERYGIALHDFETEPFPISARQVKDVCQHLGRNTSQSEVRLLCNPNTRESRPRAFRERGLFILPVKNGQYTIVKGEGYVDVPPIESPLREYQSEFPFELDTSLVGNSEMQHIDRAYALSLIRHFSDDESLVLTIRGRKYTPRFDFMVGGRFRISAQSVQTEVDGGYEGANRVVLIEAKGKNTSNTIIRQLYYPFRQWQRYTEKPISTLFFHRTDNDEYHIWQFGFDDVDDYNSIRLLKSARYKIVLPA